MNPNEYQELAARTLIERPEVDIPQEDVMILWNGLGLAGEAGEVVDLIKKGICHRHGLDKEKVVKELGDVMWYVAGLCTQLGIDLEEVMKANIEKINARYPNGFSSEASIQAHARK